MNASGYEAVIGLEVHVQLATDSKMFSTSPTAFGADANSQANLVDLAMPGALPVANSRALAMAVRFGLAVGAEIRPRSIFTRKNYFYPDLPKGYQISQHKDPILVGGGIDLPAAVGSEGRHIRLTRAHLEEDAGKSMHMGADSRIDLNRAGVPLLEVVSEPDLRSPAEAVAYAREIHTLAIHIAICDGDMEKGNLRFDANISLRPRGAEKLGIRAEIKNLNSFRFLERALDFEIKRQGEILSDGGEVVQETRLFSEKTGETHPMRAKEDAEDYRYFPDPDLPPLILDAEVIEEERASLPELPAARRRRYSSDFGLRAEECDALLSDPARADFFDRATEAAAGRGRLVANWLLTEVMGRARRHGLEVKDIPLAPEALGQLVARVAGGALSHAQGKQLLERLWGEGGSEKDVDALIAASGFADQAAASDLAELAQRVLAAHPRQVEEYRSGKKKVFGFLVGRALSEAGRGADARALGDALREALAAPGELD